MMQTPVAYMAQKGHWLCPTCFWGLNCPATPFHQGDLAGLQSPICQECEGVILPKSVEAPETCVFCEIVAGNEPVEWIVQPDYWPDVVAFIPLNPVTKGHALVVPKVHVRDFAENPEVFAATARRAAELMQFTPRAMNVITSRGRAATQSVFHLHLHLVPREDGDGLALPWYSGRRGEKT